MNKTELLALAERLEHPNDPATFLRNAHEAATILCELAALKPVAWAVLAEVDGEMIPQYPIGLSPARSRSHAEMYDKKNRVEVAALFNLTGIIDHE